MVVIVMVMMMVVIMVVVIISSSLLLISMQGQSRLPRERKTAVPLSHLLVERAMQLSAVNWIANNVTHIETTFT